MSPDLHRKLSNWWVMHKERWQNCPTDVAAAYEAGYKEGLRDRHPAQPPTPPSPPQSLPDAGTGV